MDYDAILKNRQEVLDLVNAGKIQDAFLRIVDGAFIYSETDKECPHDVSVLQEKIIEGLIQHVTDENYRDIFIILNRIASFFGLSQRLCIEISLLNVTRKIDTDFQLQFLESLPAPIRQDPVIRLIEAETYRQAGNFIKALTIYNALPLRKAGGHLMGCGKLLPENCVALFWKSTLISLSTKAFPLLDGTWNRILLMP